MYRSPDQLLRSLKMVKLTGPALAHQAAGQLARELTFSTNKGRAYLKRHRTPRQPRTKAQSAPRAMLSFLSAAWKEIPNDRQNTWLELAAPREITPHNAYLAYNLDRWRNFKAPSQSYPATETHQYSSWQDHVVTGMPLAVRHLITYDYQYDGWGFVIHHLDSAADGRRCGNLCHAIRTPTPGDYNYVLRGLQPGLHYFMTVPFSIDGKMMVYDWLRTATVTN